MIIVSYLVHSGLSENSKELKLLISVATLSYNDLLVLKHGALNLIMPSLLRLTALGHYFQEGLGAQALSYIYGLNCLRFGLIMTGLHQLKKILKTLS